MMTANSRLAWVIQMESLFFFFFFKVLGIVVLQNEVQNWCWKSPIYDHM